MSKRCLIPTVDTVHNTVCRYKKLIFSVLPASEQYHHKIDDVLAGAERVQKISDDQQRKKCEL